MDDHHGKHRTGAHHHHHRPRDSGERAIRESHHTRPDPIPKSAPHQKDYVHRWLEQTAEEPPEDVLHIYNKHRSTALSSNSSLPGKPKFPQFLQSKSHDSQRLDNNDCRKHDLEVSSESSFLERGHAPVTERRPSTERDDSLDQNASSHHPDGRKRKRSPTPSIESRPPSRERPKETFERRLRHKTKEDRYEPKTKPDKERKSKPKKEKKGEQQKMAKTSGENLMHSFESKHVGNGRLTIRPAHKLGLFKNGRASSPRRGMPDLAFSEMEFLRRSKTDRQEKPPPPKSRKKERRREERTFNEITSYFTAGKEPLTEMNVNRQDFDSSPAKRPPDKLYESLGRRQMTDWNQGQSTVPDATNSLERPYLGFRRQASIPDKFRVPEMRTPSKNHQRATDTASRLSGPAITYVSWSESRFSPNIGIYSDRPQPCSERERSSTPESVRQAIARTGVFRDTGLQRYSVLSANEEMRARLRKLQQDAEISSHTENLASRPGPPNNSRVMQIHDQPPIFDLSKFTADVPQQAVELPEEHAKGAETNKKTSPEAVVHHYDPKLGWHQNEADEGRASIQDHVNNLVTAEPVRPSRMELAKTAYIKPPPKPSSNDVDAQDVRKEAPGNMAGPEPLAIIRPASAPPRTSVPTVSRPYLGAKPSSAALLRHENRPAGLVGQEDLGSASIQFAQNYAQSLGPPQESLHQRVEATSLPSLTDRASASSIRRSESIPSIQNFQANERLPYFHDRLPPKPLVDSDGSFGLPIRGAWPRQNFDRSPNLSIPPISITDSLYGQQLEREHVNNLQNEYLNPAFDDNLLLDNANEIDFTREEEFIQRLSHDFQEPHSMQEYSYFSEPESRMDIASNADFVMHEDDGNYYERGQPLDAYPGNDFQRYDYQRPHEFLENEEDGYARDDLHEYGGYDADLYQPYLDESCYRAGAVEEDMENSSAGLWRLPRQY